MWISQIIAVETFISTCWCVHDNFQQNDSSEQPRMSIYPFCFLKGRVHLRGDLGKRQGRIAWIQSVFEIKSWKNKTLSCRDPCEIRGDIVCSWVTTAFVLFLQISIVNSTKHENQFQCGEHERTCRLCISYTS